MPKGVERRNARKKVMEDDPTKTREESDGYWVTDGMNNTQRMKALGILVVLLLSINPIQSLPIDFSFLSLSVVEVIHLNKRKEETNKQTNKGYQTIRPPQKQTCLVAAQVPFVAHSFSAAALGLVWVRKKRTKPEPDRQFWSENPEVAESEKAILKEDQRQQDSLLEPYRFLA